MNKAGLKDGMTARVRPCQTPAHGDVVVAVLGDDSVSVKRFHQTTPVGIYAGAWIVPESTDPHWQARPLWEDDRIVGVVERPDRPIPKLSEIPMTRASLLPQPAPRVPAYEPALPLPQYLARRFPPIGRWYRTADMELIQVEMAGRVGSGDIIERRAGNSIEIPSAWAMIISTDFVVIAMGVSMTERGIMPFDLLHVKEKQPPLPGNVVIANVGDKGAAVCREFHEEAGRLYLRSNQGLPYELEQHVEITREDILGVVVLVETPGSCAPPEPQEPEPEPFVPKPYIPGPKWAHAAPALLVFGAASIKRIVASRGVKEVIPETTIPPRPALPEEFFAYPRGWTSELRRRSAEEDYPEDCEKMLVRYDEWVAEFGHLVDDLPCPARYGIQPGCIASEPHPAPEV